jgi:hypothetical protein
MIKNQNFARTDPKLKEGDILENCNLSQEKANTEICKGIKKLEFRGCNLMNCKLPTDAKKTDCNITQQDMPAPTPPDPDQNVKLAIADYGKDNFLRVIGKTYCKQYWGL